MSEQRLEGCRLLVVEDDLLVASLIEDILTDEGANVVGSVTSVQEALQFIEREKVDGATLDGNLGGEISGPVANALSRRGIPFVVVTGFVDLATADPELAGAPRLVKPFTAASLAKFASMHLC